jgi:hypothetical protein
MNEFVKQQTTDEFLKEMFFQLREHSFSQVSLLNGADGKTTSPLTGETVMVSQRYGYMNGQDGALLI